MQKNTKTPAQLVKAAKFAGLRGTEINDFVIRYMNGLASLREEQARNEGN